MRNNFSIIAVAIFLSGFLSCKTFEGTTVSCAPDPIEVHADSIKYQIKASIPPKSGFRKGGIYTGEAKIAGFSQRKVVISTERYPAIKKTGMDTTIKIQAPYKETMDNNSLMIQQSYMRKSKEIALPNIEDLCECCLTTSRMVYDQPQVAFSEFDYKKVVPINVEARFNFPKNVFDIQSGDYDKADIKSIGEFISKKFEATSITIVGFASPEGPYQRNVLLSVNRSKVVQEWLTKQLKDAGYEAYLDSSLFKISVTHEDWDGFKKSIQSQPYTQDVKTQILEIVSGGLSEDEREKQIMALVGGKDKVEFLLAPLRRATIKVDGFEPRRTDEEIDKIAQDFLDGSLTGNLKDFFGKEEWLYAISKKSKMNDKKALLESFRDAYPADPRAFNDLGAISLLQDDKDAAINYLEKAEKLRANDPAVLNNLGAAYMKNAKYKEAKSALESALSASSGSPEANFNMGVVLEKMARYNLAIEKFNKASEVRGSDYNIGLCKMLMGDNAGAKAALSEAAKGEADQADAFYLLAVVGARNSDISSLTVNIKKAGDLNPSYKNKARKDLEFRKYWSNSEFKAAVGM